MSERDRERKREIGKGREVKEREREEAAKRPLGQALNQFIEI